MVEKLHTTNYFDTFIAVADDCPAAAAEVPQAKAGKPTVASRQFELAHDHPYELTSDDVLFTVQAERDGGEKSRAAYFSKGRACFRSSPLTKRYGWGVHADADGRIAIYAVESPEYRKFVVDKSLEHTRGMRSKRA